MPRTVIQELPKQKLLFYVTQDIDSSIKHSVRELVDSIARSRSWVIAAPRVVDNVDRAEENSSDAGIETIGGELEIYSAAQPTELPREIDRQHLEEVEATVEAVRVLSEKLGLAFEFELAGVYVGAIADGRVNRTLRTGLLDEWRKQLGIAVNS